MKALKWIAVGVAIAILAVLTIVLSQLMVVHAPPTIEYFDLLMVVLTVLSIMITPENDPALDQRRCRPDRRLTCVGACASAFRIRPE